jgi:hypothetical protein
MQARTAKAKKELREAVERAERGIEAPQAKIDALAGSEKREDHFCSPARAVPGVRVPPMGNDRTTDDRPSDHTEVLIAELQYWIPALEEVDSENPCIIAAFTSRIPAIEAPSDDSGSLETSAGRSRRDTALVRYDKLARGCGGCGGGSGGRS